LLEKVTAWSPTAEETIKRMDRALREFRIRGVATNLTFLENIIGHPEFLDNSYTTKFIDSTPELFEQVKRKALMRVIAQSHAMMNVRWSPRGSTSP